MPKTGLRRVRSDSGHRLPNAEEVKMMRTFLVSALALGATASLALAEPAAAADPQPGLVELTDAQMDRVTAGADTPTDPSWGDLTRNVAGYELGQHSSGEDTPRVGLANIVEQGNLAATIAIIGTDLP